MRNTTGQTAISTERTEYGAQSTTLETTSPRLAYTVVAEAKADCAVCNETFHSLDAYIVPGVGLVRLVAPTRHAGDSAPFPSHVLSPPMQIDFREIVGGDGSRAGVLDRDVIWKMLRKHHQPPSPAQTPRHSAEATSPTWTSHGDALQTATRSWPCFPAYSGTFKKILSETGRGTDSHRTWPLSASSSRRQ